MTELKSTVDLNWNMENSYLRLPKSFYSVLNPVPVRAPKLVALNNVLAASLGFDVELLQSEDGVGVLTGNRIANGSIPLAQVYAGHQFGHFTMLGDGRALLLGEQITPAGERYDIQLKGSGRTPYSRGGDGRAALGPMLREYIISEAMYALGIPTTRSLAVVSTGEPVYRATELPGAVLTRIASSHLRIATFQYASRWGGAGDIQALADYTLQRHFPDTIEGDHKYLTLLQEVVKLQAILIAKWQLVGFIHGVMNTDNVALSGETIDYGPCAFMDVYDPATVFSSIDTHGRYAYGNQPSIDVWNLARFAETLLPLLNPDLDLAAEIAQDAISTFKEVFNRNWLKGMRAKLGIFNEETEDESLIDNLLHMMYENRADYTNTFRALTLGQLEEMSLKESSEFRQWYELWQARLSRQQEPAIESRQLMKNSNPAVIPRNHRVEEALDTAVKDDNYSVMNRFLDVLMSPYNYSTDYDDYSKPPAASDCPYRTFCGT